MNEALIGSILIAIVLIVILMILVSCIKIVPQATAMVVERLGGYKCTWSVPGGKTGDFKRAGCGFRSSARYHEG